MARKPPEMPHIKHVLRRGRWYSYFNTGKKNANRNPIRQPLPEWGTPEFHSRYATMLAARGKQAAVAAYTVTDLVRDYLASAEYATKAIETQRGYAMQARKIIALWGKFPVDDLQPADVRTVIAGEAWGAGTVNLVLSVLGLLYKWGRQHNRATIDPVRDIDRQKVGEHAPWPEDVLEAALASDDNTIRLAVHLLYFTGQRIGDVCAMRWGNVANGKITIRQGKTGKLVSFAQSAELRAELARWPKTTLPIMGGIAVGPLRRKLQAFTRSLGFETVPHGLRKNAVNSLLLAQCSVAEVAAITGQTYRYVEHYASQIDRMRLGNAAISKLDDARNKAGAGKQAGKQAL